MTDYIPVECNRHSEYELAIMRHNRLRLYWRTVENQVNVKTLQPFNLVTCKREEFLLANDHSGNTFKIRLDRIIESKVV